MKLDHLLDLASLARPLATGAAYRRALPRVVTLIVLGIAAGLLLAALLFGGLYGFWQWLNLQGWEATQALWATLGLTAALFLLLVAAIARTLRKLKRSLLPSTTYVGQLADAFMDGLRTPGKAE